MDRREQREIGGTVDYFIDESGQTGDVARPNALSGFSDQPFCKSLDRRYVTHDELMLGGTLKFVFSSEKEAEWSVALCVRRFPRRVPANLLQELVPTH